MANRCLMGRVLNRAEFVRSVDPVVGRVVEAGGIGGSVTLGVYSTGWIVRVAPEARGFPLRSVLAAGPFRAVSRFGGYGGYDAEWCGISVVRCVMTRPRW